MQGVFRDPDLKLVGAIDKKANSDQITLPDGSHVFYSQDAQAVIERCRPQVIVDFSAAEATIKVARSALKQKVAMVIGTTGLSQAEVDEIALLAKENRMGVVLAANFALGAVLMMHFAAIAAKFFDYAEIIELHHHEKADAPSGTALMTARAMVERRGGPFESPVASKKTLEGTRGGQLGGVSIHSVRLPGLVAHQEVLLGTSGQTLNIRHDTVSRECYVPGVVLAVKKVRSLEGLTVGLDKLLGL